MSSSETRYFQNLFDNSKNETPIAVNLYTARIISYVKEITENVKYDDRDCRSGVYTGTAGIAYALYYLHNSDHLCQSEFLRSAKAYIDVALKCSSKRRPVGLLSGESGVLAVAAVIYKKCGDEKKALQCIMDYQKLFKVCEPVNFLREGSDELFVGRTGYLLGLLLIQRELKTEVLPPDKIHHLIDVAIAAGKECKASMRISEDIPLMYCYHGKPYLGSAHGIAGILQVLLSFPDFLKNNPRASLELKSCVDFLLNRCMRNGNVATNLDGALSDRGRYLVHWCHGAAGVVYTFARAYLVWNKEKKYLDACKALADTVWRFGLLKKGPGICHGVAGSGYVFLLMYRLTKDSMYLRRAQRFAEFLFSDEFRVGARIPDRPHSLFEGLAGTVCFLTDLLQPDKAEFPLCDVFVENEA